MIPVSQLYISSWFLVAAAAGFLVIKPSSLVVEHGAPASANCSTNISHTGMGWESSQDPIPMKTGVQFLTWKVENVTHYDLKPICYINGADQKDANFSVTVYKIPARVSISLKNHTGHLIEGRSYTLHCDVQRVAPVRSLIVSWHQNEVVLNRKGNFSGATPFPVNESAIHQIEARRSIDGATYWCEAELELGPEGPAVPPSKKSVPLSVSVHYKPEFSNQTEIIFQSQEEIILNCTVISNPPPVYTWSSTHLEQEHQGSVLVLEPKSPGNYTCRASNSYGQDEKIYIIQARPEGPVLPSWVLGLIVMLVLFLALLLLIVILCKRKKAMRTWWLIHPKQDVRTRPDAPPGQTSSVEG